MESGRILFLGVAFASHALVGVAVVRAATGVDPRVGVVFGLLPDADFLFPPEWGWPLVHRGITHTPLFGLVLVGCVYAVRRDRTGALAAGLALGSHLAIDSFSPAGVQWLYPVATNEGLGLAVHGSAATAVLWTVSIGILARHTDDLSIVRRRLPSVASIRSRRADAVSSQRSD